MPEIFNISSKNIGFVLNISCMLIPWYVTTGGFNGYSVGKSKNKTGCCIFADLVNDLYKFIGTYKNDFEIPTSGITQS